MTEKQALAAVHRYQQQQARKRSIFLVVDSEAYACHVVMATADRTVAAQEVRVQMTGELGVSDPHCPVWKWQREPNGLRPRIWPASEPDAECPFSIREVKDGAPIMIGYAE